MSSIEDMSSASKKQSFETPETPEKEEREKDEKDKETEGEEAKQASNDVKSMDSRAEVEALQQATRMKYDPAWWSSCDGDQTQEAADFDDVSTTNSKSVSSNSHKRRRSDSNGSATTEEVEYSESP